MTMHIRSRLIGRFNLYNILAAAGVACALGIEPRAIVPEHGVATMEEIVEVTADGVRYLSEPQTEILLVRS